MSTKYRKKPVVIEAITFPELVQYGKDNGGNIVNGMPWSFSYKGQPITHENDECYLIPTLEGSMRFTPNDMLITGVKGEIYPCKKDIFEATYEPLDKIKKRDKIRVVNSLATSLKVLGFDENTATTMGRAYAGTEQVALATWRDREHGQQYVTIDLCVEIPVECCEKID